ncbi:MAG: hypothetical protein WBW49_18710, partial [Candidatus Acidiferrum sp.]
MIRRVLREKNFVACVLAAITGIVLYFRYPFPEQNFFLELIFLWARPVFQGMKFCYTIFLYTTPYIIYSFLLSGLYIFTLKPPPRPKAGKPAAYPSAPSRSSLFLVLGEVHNQRTPEPSPAPYWLTIPERGLFTGIAVFGAVGSGKTSAALYPYAEQILSYEAGNPEKRIGGLVLEVKGDFCRKVRTILGRLGRESDYVEISLDSKFRYNPLHNGLDAYALAYGIASLINNLFGRGKEPFWQQAYTNRVKFIILLHKIAYDYVTLFDVYECTICPDVLERKIRDAELRLEERYFLLIHPDNFMGHVADLKAFNFQFDDAVNMFRARETPGLRAFVKSSRVECECLSEAGFDQIDADRYDQLQSVKRWFYNDWRRIEPKLRTS